MALLRWGSKNIMQGTSHSDLQPLRSIAFNPIGPVKKHAVSDLFRKIACGFFNAIH